MEGMFRGATSFSGDISSWEISAVKEFWNMFYQATSFDKKLCWNDISGVDTGGMFDDSGGGSVSSVADGTCEFCSYGKFRNSVDGSCELCPAGSYGPLPLWGSGSVGVDSCLPCTAGHSNPTEGQAACFPCAAGSFQPEGGFHASCIPCSGGFFGVGTGRTSCDDACAAGMYSAGGAASCFSFTSETLRTAVTAWCAGDNITYGDISTWKTGGVSDMSALFAPSGVDITIVNSSDFAGALLKSGACGEGDRNDFDADICKWNGRLIYIVFWWPDV